MQIGDRIKQVRILRGLTAKEVSCRAGLSQGYVSRLENNERVPSNSTILKIANVLHVSPSYLLDGTGQPPLGSHLSLHLKEFVNNYNNVQWIQAAYDAKQAGLSPDVLRHLLIGLGLELADVD